MSLENKILTLTEATIVLDEISIIDRESGTDNQKMKDVQVKPSEFIGYVFPYIIINTYEFTTDEIYSFEMNCYDFLPICRIKVFDKTTQFSGKYFPKDGDVISVFLKSPNKELYKDVRIDFDFISIDPITNKSELTSYIIIGQMKVPGLYGEYCKSYVQKTSFDTLMDVSQELKLGYASNIEDTADKMTWINPFDTNYKFIEDTVKKSYLNEDTFFISYIDFYYNLTFIDLNRIFADGDVEETEIFLKNLPTLGLTEEETAGKMDGYQIFSNLKQLQGTSKYVTKFRPVNNTGQIFLRNGYKRYAQFFDVGESDEKNGKFISEYVDPFTTEGTDSLVHLKGRYVGDIDNRKHEGLTDFHLKYKYLGKQNTGSNGNVHDNYLFSHVLNYQNNEEVYKMGMVMDLEVMDLTLYKYQKIFLAVYDYGQKEKEMYNASDPENEEDINNRPRLNKMLSGAYVINGIEYVYSYPGPIKQKIRLIRREFDPNP